MVRAWAPLLDSTALSDWAGELSATLPKSMVWGEITGWPLGYSPSPARPMDCSGRAPPDMVMVSVAASGRALTGVNVTGTVIDPPAATVAGRADDGVPTVKSVLSELIPVMVRAEVLVMVRVWVVELPRGVVAKLVGETDRGWTTGAPKPKISPLMFPT